MADYLAEKGKAISQTFTCKLPYHSAKQKVKRSIQADLSRYYTTLCQHKLWNKTAVNRYITPDSPREDAVAAF
jgi:hypothetical protein